MEYKELSKEQLIKMLIAEKKRRFAFQLMIDELKK